MAEWIGVGISALLLLAAVIAFFVREGSWKTKSRDKDDSLHQEINALRDTFKLELSHTTDGLERVEKILGNGKGLINDVRLLEKCIEVNEQKTAGAIKDIHTRLSAQQHEIDDIKKA